MWLITLNEVDKNKLDQALTCTRVVDHWREYKPEYLYWCIRYLNIACGIKPKRLGLYKPLKHLVKQMDKELTHCQNILKYPSRSLASRNYVEEQAKEFSYKLSWYNQILVYLGSDYEVIAYLPKDHLNCWQGFQDIDYRSLAYS